MANSFIYQEHTFAVGDTVNVALKVTEGDKVRNQLFTGIIIGISGHQAGKSFIVRKIASGGIGVERILPLASPDIASITVKSRGHVRRGKLYFLRGRVGRQATRVKIKRTKTAQEAKPAHETADQAARKSRRAPRPRLSGK